jgi:hypothetical protein
MPTPTRKCASAFNSTNQDTAGEDEDYNSDDKKVVNVLSNSHLDARDLENTDSELDESLQKQRE